MRHIDITTPNENGLSEYMVTQSSNNFGDQILILKKFVSNQYIEIAHDMNTEGAWLETDDIKNWANRMIKSKENEMTGNEYMQEKINERLLKGNEMNFTKGPWASISLDENYKAIIKAPGANCNIGEVGGWGTDQQTTQANAHLISSAPDMHHALQVVAQYMNHMNTPFEVMKVVSDALEKAKGR